MAMVGFHQACLVADGDSRSATDGSTFCSLPEVSAAVARRAKRTQIRERSYLYAGLTVKSS